MRRIPLTQGQFALVDDEWYDELAQWKWQAKYNACTQSYYATRTYRENGVRHYELMHRRITGFVWAIVDHMDFNTLNNQQGNLRDGTKGNTQHRRPHRAKTSSQYHGVCWDAANNKWRATIRLDGRLRHLGRFVDEVEAARAYDRASRELHGDYGTRNFEEASCS